MPTRAHVADADECKDGVCLVSMVLHPGRRKDPVGCFPTHGGPVTENMEDGDMKWFEVWILTIDRPDGFTRRYRAKDCETAENLARAEFPDATAFECDYAED